MGLTGIDAGLDSGGRFIERFEFYDAAERIVAIANKLSRQE